MDDLAALRDVGEGLKRTVRSGRVSPAYLFEGPDRADAREAALLFAAELVAGEEPPSPALRQRVLALEHPDVHVLEKDKPTVISVAALASVLEQAHQTPLEAVRQVFVVDPAEAMEAAGIARYLKTLEEPPARTVFVLVSRRPDRLPQTVLSRVRRVRLPPHDESHIARALAREGAGTDEARRVARWSGGSLGRARRLVETAAPEHARALVVSPDGAAAAVERVASELARTAAERVERGAAEDKRQEIRRLLQDLLHLLACEARDRAAGREAALWSHRTQESALGDLEVLGRLSGAVGLNVTPAVVLLEVARRFRRA